MTKEDLIVKILFKSSANSVLSVEAKHMLAGKIVGALELFEDLFETNPPMWEPEVQELDNKGIEQGDDADSRSVVVKKSNKTEPEVVNQFLDEPRDLDEMFDEFQQEFPTVMEMKVFPTKPAMEVTCYVGKLLNSQTYLDKDGKGKSGVTLRIVKKRTDSEDVILFPDRFIFCEENISAKDVKEEAIKMIKEQVSRGGKEIPVRVLPAVHGVPDNINNWGGGNAV